MKRLLDIVLVLASLPVAVPVALIIAIAIKLDSPGPVIYYSERIGKDGKHPCQESENSSELQRKSRFPACISNFRRS